MTHGVCAGAADADRHGGAEPTDFESFQREAVRYAASEDVAHELVPMLGVGAHVGKLLLAQQRYLLEAMVASTSRDIVARQLGMVLRWSALLADIHGLRLNDVAHANLVKVDRRARSLHHPGIEKIPLTDEALSLTAYQELAAETDQEISVGFDPLSLSVPMLGLAGEAGNLLVEMKKRFRGDSKIPDWKSFVAEELGDLLWYVAAVARHLNLGLDSVGVGDLERFARVSTTTSAEAARRLDDGYPETEQFPRQLHLRFQERMVNGRATVAMTLLGAWPNAFPDGPIPRGGDKTQGFTVGRILGDEVTDNSRRVDAYRYHDAIHLGFLAVLGWSPNLRTLLHLKRKSDDVVDQTEDGARAIFAEEGIAAILAKQAPASRQFETPSLVPESLLDLIVIVVEDLEVGGLPYRVWREAISQGFSTKRQLTEGSGGYVLADLDKRTLQYSKFPFAT